LIIVDFELFAKDVVVDEIAVIDREMKTVVELNFDADVEKYFSFVE